MSPDERIATISAKQHGAFTTRQALSVGFSRHGIKHRNYTGRWFSPCRGVHAIAGVPLTNEHRIISAVLSLGPQALAASLSAAWLQGFVDEPGDHVYVIRPSGRKGIRRKGLVIIEARLARADIRTARNIPATAPNRTIVDAAGTLSPRAFEACLDEAILLGRTSVASLSRYIKERRLEHRPGAKELKALLNDRTQGVTQRELERLFLRKIRTSTLPEPRRQHPVGKRKIDFAYPQALIAIELDSLAHHFTGDDFRSDRRRQNEIVLAGWTPLRFTWDDVNDEWHRVERTIREALGLPESR